MDFIIIKSFLSKLLVKNINRMYNKIKKEPSKTIVNKLTGKNCFMYISKSAGGIIDNKTKIIFLLRGIMSI